MGEWAAAFFYFLRNEGLRLRKRNGFRVFYFRFFFVFCSLFSEKSPHCEFFFSSLMHMAENLLI